MILSLEIYDAEREDAFGVYSIPERKTLLLTLGGEGSFAGENVKIGTLMPRVGDGIDLFGRAKISGICLRVRAI